MVAALIGFLMRNNNGDDFPTADKGVYKSQWQPPIPHHPNSIWIYAPILQLVKSLPWCPEDSQARKSQPYFSSLTEPACYPMAYGSEPDCDE